LLVVAEQNHEKCNQIAVPDKSVRGHSEHKTKAPPLETSCSVVKELKFKYMALDGYVQNTNAR
jgi:hypothetical protein